MTLRPCLDCGEPTSATRCPACQPVDPSPSSRGYTAAWRRLSARARKLSPFCEDCGRTDDLTVDHTPEAWARQAARKPIRLADVAVVCRSCNSRRGPARGPNARARDQGGRPERVIEAPPAQAKFGLLTGNLGGKAS